MKIKSIVSFLLLCMLFLPVLVFAQAGGITIAQPQTQGTSIQSIMQSAANAIWYVFAGLSIIMFLIAGILFLTANGQPEKVSTARQAAIWGVVGVIVGLLAGGIVSFVSTSFK